MSTYYRPTKPIPLDAIKKNKYLKDIGFEVIDTKNKQYFLYDSCIHYSTDKQNNVIDLYRYGGNKADDILDPLANEFEVGFVSEYEDEYEYYYHPDTPVMKINIEDLRSKNNDNKKR